MYQGLLIGLWALMVIAFLKIFFAKQWGLKPSHIINSPFNSIAYSEDLIATVL